VVILHQHDAAGDQPYNVHMSPYTIRV